jgi:bifunctional non-homologous end joining protein LigD
MATAAKSRAQTSVELPAFHPFQLATLADRVPAGDDWLFEMKYDGYRCQAAIAGDRVKLYSRRGYDWTRQFGYLVPYLANLTSGTVLLDGEVCVFDGKGRSDFSRLKSSLDGKQPVTFMVFDLLEQDGEPVWKLPQVERKQRLEALLGQIDPSAPVQFSQHVEGHATRCSVPCARAASKVWSPNAPRPPTSSGTGHPTG